MKYTEMFQIETIWWIKVSEQQDLQEPTEMNEPLSKAWDVNEDDINTRGSISNAGFHKPSQTMRSTTSSACWSAEAELLLQQQDKGFWMEDMHEKRKR